MHDLNWWLMALSFLAGLALTFLVMIRKVTREVPVTQTVSAAVTTGGAAAAGAAAAATLTAPAAKAPAIKDVLEHDPYGAGSIRVTSRFAAPEGYVIKGDKDTRRYFTVDSPEYGDVTAEVWFADEESAKKAGFLHWASAVAAKVKAAIDDVPAGPHGKGSAKAGADGSGPSGWLIKGNADSMLFHGPDSPAYEQTIAEVWFFDENTARAAGFDKWDKNFK